MKCTMCQGTGNGYNTPGSNRDGIIGLVICNSCNGTGNIDDVDVEIDALPDTLNIREQRFLSDCGKLTKHNEELLAKVSELCQDKQYLANEASRLQSELEQSRLDNQELLRQNRSLVEQVNETGAKLQVAEKALDKACCAIADATGACPLDTFDWDNNCDNCAGDGTGNYEANCYAMYYLSTAKSELGIKE